MIDDSTAREGAQTLLHAWREASTLEALPGPLKPATRAEGYAIQAEWLRQSGGRSRAWKIAATSAAGQAHIGVEGPLAGRILDDHVHCAGETLSLRGNRMRLAEVEFAFRMGRTLAPRRAAWRSEEVLEAVEALLPAIELPDSRYVTVETAGEAQLIADNACAWRFVIGEPAPASWRELDLADWTARADVGGRYRREGEGRNVLGGPVLALTWLANELSSHGLALEAGQTVTTGTCLAPLPIQPGDHLQVDFGELGQVDVRFTE